LGNEDTAVSDIELHNYLGITAMLLVSVALASIFSAIGFLFGPRNPNARKMAPYECGIEDLVPMPKRFPVKFLQIGMLFLIFDVEAIALYPAVTVLKDAAAQGQGLYVLGTVASFLAVIVIGFAYQWKRGAFEWIS
jgi:NADH-quinone oxidoreductase subunit A